MRLYQRRQRSFPQSVCQRPPSRRHQAQSHRRPCRCHSARPSGDLPLWRRERSCHQGHDRKDFSRHHRADDRQQRWLERWCECRRHGGDRWAGQTAGWNQDQPQPGKRFEWCEPQFRLSVSRSRCATKGEPVKGPCGGISAMSPSRPFILRPVATTLLMVGVLLVGWVAFRQLPISALPQVDYPTIQVQTFYPGASPEVMASSVTAPLERQFGQIPGLNQMTSTSSFGSSLITLQFGLDLSIDVAEQGVQAAINGAANLLPQGLPNPPIYSKVNPADAPIMTLALTSNSLPLSKVEDLADTTLAQKISQLSGVGLVSISGGQRPAVRIQANPTALASYGMSLEDLRTALGQANVDQAKGTFDGPHQAYTIGANDQLISTESYRPLIINIQRQPGANIIAVVDRVKKLLPALQAALPAAVKVDILTDRTTTIRASVDDVQFTLVLTIALVVMVIFLFLRSIRATIIPSVAVPLSLIGTFGVMYLLGYSLNNLSLMALTISTGFVVDDAIVMIENISRYIEEGESPLQAALKGSEQI